MLEARGAARLPPLAGAAGTAPLTASSKPIRASAAAASGVWAAAAAFEAAAVCCNCPNAEDEAPANCAEGAEIWPPVPTNEVVVGGSAALTVVVCDKCTTEPDAEFVVLAGSALETAMPAPADEPACTALTSCCCCSGDRFEAKSASC